MKEYIIVIYNISDLSVRLYEIPLKGINDKEEAIRKAYELKHCLKDQYVVGIHETKMERYCIGYVTID